MSTGYQLKIAVCDDVESDCARVANLTQQILWEEGVAHSISRFSSSQSLLDAIRHDAQFRVLLLDVVMDELDGIALARALRQQNDKSAIVFISSNQEMALCGYEVSATRYLSKPVSPDKLREALLYCYNAWREKEEILLMTNYGQRRTPLSEIQFVEAYDRGSKFVLLDETVECKLKFSEAIALLPQSVFIQCHRAYIVNIANIKRIHTNEFEMRSGAVVPISKHRSAMVCKKVMDYLAD